MKNIILFLSLVMCTTIFTSCATLFNKPQSVTVTSDVDGADVYFGTKYVGKTPLTINTKKQKPYITVKKEGYEPQKLLTVKKVNAKTLWNVFNCFGGVFVDLFSNTFTKYKQTNYFVSLKDPSINEKHNEAILKKREKRAQIFAIAATATLAGLTAYAGAVQADNAKKAEEKRIQEEQRRAQTEAIMKANFQKNVQSQRAAEQQERSKMAAAMMNNQIPTGSNTNRRMETSDLAQYNAVRMSDATLGTNATNQALAQQRLYDAEQRQQSRISTQRNSDMNLGVTENAVTSSGERIQIKVNNGTVTAYSTSRNNFSGTGPEWNRVNVVVSKSRDTRYGYEANIAGIGKKVYWGEHPQTVSDNLGGTAVNAITANGMTIQIRVQNEMVIAYRKNGNLPWNNRTVIAKKTNVTYDGEEIAVRFKYKAELPEIGTIYF